MPLTHLRALLLAAIVALTSPLLPAADAQAPLRSDLNESVIMVTVPAAIGSVDLETTLFKPDGNGPFPLVVINHGKDLGIPAWQGRARYPLIAEEFLQRGYAVALPMRRGFANSRGTYADTGCSISANGRAEAQDVARVIGWLKQQPWVDAERILVMGQSHGGLTTMALADMDIPGVRGIINFAGGLRFSGSDRCNWESMLKSAFGDYGKSARIDSLWFYGSNDALFEPDLVKQLYERYTQAGGKAELVAYGPFRQNAHGMFGTREGFEKIWWPKAEVFLAAHGLPVAVIHPDRYHDLPAPPATGFAQASDVAAMPYASKGCRDLYQRLFVSAGNPKAFAISEDGACGGQIDYEEGPTTALNTCRKFAKHDTCKLYLVNDSVVWPAKQ